MPYLYRFLTFCLWIGCLCTNHPSFAQMETSLIGSLGGEISGAQVSLIQSIGDLAGSSIQGNSGLSLTQGFAQCFVCSKEEPDTDSTQTSIDLLFNSIQVYPNPVQDILFLKGERSMLKRVEIISSTGQLILNSRLEHSGLSLAHLPPALYLLRIYGVNDELTYIGKLMKKE